MTRGPVIRLVKYEDISITVKCRTRSVRAIQHSEISIQQFPLTSRGYNGRMKRLSAVALLLVLASIGANGCGRNEATTAQAPGLKELPLSSMPKIDQNKILDHIRVLSSDEYEGRKPGSQGEELAVKYIQEQFEREKRIVERLGLSLRS